MAEMFFQKTKNDNGTLTLTFARTDQEMNVLGEVVLRELDGILDEVIADTSLKGLVICSGKTDHFVVGADIREIASLKTREAATGGSASMQAVFQKLHTLKIPTVAAIHGQCLGGGLEMSLACMWRIVTDSPKTQLALPEIQLGLIPGAGGTQRLPRTIGIQTALDMILTGKRIPGPKALKIKLADACVPQHLLLEEAQKWATKKRHHESALGHFAKSLFGPEVATLALEGNPVGRRIMMKKAREMVDKKTKGFYPASYKALEAVFDGFEMSLVDGLRLEAQLFGELAVTTAAQSLIHLFHATTAIKKHKYRDANSDRFGDSEVALIGVIGGGFMGAGIATVAADKDIRVRVTDPSKESLGKCLKHVRDFFASKAEKRRIKPFQVGQKTAYVSTATTSVGMGSCDVVIEAVFESLELKQKILRDVEKKAHADWVFASNTSALPISDIASASTMPDRVVGMHFFSPVEKMPLLEVVATQKSAPWAVGRVAELGRKMGKQVIVVQDSPGFYTTRALAFYLAEAAQMLIEGERIEVIDKALAGFGYPVGPITLIDEVGIDVGIHVLKTIEAAYPDRMKSPPAMLAIEKSGRLGRKNSKGFYVYHEGKKTNPDTEIYRLAEVTKKPSLDKQTIIDRCNLVFVNETVRCLEEKILANAYDGDVGAVFGLGFPPFRGGPFKYIDLVGVDAIVARLDELAKIYGSRFEPAAMLREIASRKAKFFPDE